MDYGPLAAGFLCRSRVERDREAELAADGVAADDVRLRWRGLEPRLTAAFEQLPNGRLEATIAHPGRGRVTGFEVIIVALRHAAEHQGQAELTRDLVLARRSE